MVALPTIQEAASAASPFALAHREVKAAGYSPLVIEPGTKRPGIYSHGVWRPGWIASADTPADEATLARAVSWPNAGIGIALGSRVGDHIVICLDFDTRDPDELAALLATVPDTPMTRIGSKGEARLYRADPSIVSRAYRINGRGVLDLLAKGKQVVLPPTIHPEGMAYRYAKGCRLTKAEDLPIFTADHIARLEEALGTRGWAGGSDHATASPKGAQNAPYGRGDDDPNIWRDTNNKALERLDAWVGALGLPKARRLSNGSWEGVPFWRASGTGQSLERRKPSLKFHRDGIRDMGADKGYSALDVVESAFSCTFDDAFSWLRGKLGLDEGEGLALEAPRRLIANDDGSISDEVTGEVFEMPHANDNLGDRDLPEHLTRPPGLVGEMIDYIVETARRPNRALALASALVTLGTIIGRRDATPTASGTHLHVIALASSGAGKDHPQDAGDLLLRVASDEFPDHDLVGAPDFMSATAVIREMSDRPLRASFIDEFGAFLAKVNSTRAAGHETAIKKVILESWGKPFKIYRTPAWAAIKSAPIYAPAWSILGCSTPNKFYDALMSDDRENGLLNRMLFIPSYAKIRQRTPASRLDEVPLELAEKLRAAYRVGRTMMGEDGIPERRNVDWECERAEALWNAFAQECDDSDVEGFFVRSAEMAGRLATIVAVGRDSEFPAVSVDDIKWGIELARWSAERMAKDAGAMVADTQVGRDRARILAKVNAAPGKRVSQSDVMNDLGFTSAELNSYVRDLVEMGQLKPVEKLTPAGGGRAKVWLTAA